MASGAFHDVEEVLIYALKFAPQPEAQSENRPLKQNLDEFLRQSPLWGSGLVVERQKDYPRSVEL